MRLARLLCMAILKELAPDLYEVDPPSKFVGHRMTVARLPGAQGVWIHSPVAFDEALWAEVDALSPPGEPRHLIIPSRTHDLHLKEWMERIPAATTYAPPALQRAHPDWDVGQTLTPDFHAPWSDLLPHVCLMGATRVSEVVFLHVPTKTLVLVDCVFNMDLSTKPLLTRLFLKLDGAAGGVSTTRLFRFMVKDKPAFRASVAEVLAWDFERVLLGHGTVIDDPAGVTEVRAALQSY